MTAAAKRDDNSTLLWQVLGVVLAFACFAMVALLAWKRAKKRSVIPIPIVQNKPKTNERANALPPPPYSPPVAPPSPQPQPLARPMADAAIANMAVNNTGNNNVSNFYHASRDVVVNINFVQPPPHP